jgi:hypothetical protein
MKYFLALILIAVCLLIFNQKTAVTSSANVLKPSALATQASEKTEVHQGNQVLQNVDLYEIESQYKALSTQRLREESHKVSQELQRGAYITKANLDRLSVEERAQFRLALNTLSVIQKLLVEKQLEIMERSL